MTLFVSVWIDSPVLDTSVERASEVTVSLEQQTASADGKLDLTLWASGEQLSGFEDGLNADETVSRWNAIGGTDTRKLYRARLTERAGSSIDYHGWTDGEAVFASAERDTGGWAVKGYFPRRSVLQEFAAGCESNDVQFDLLEVSETDQLQDSQQFGLSDMQSETLLTALERGYYEVPREVKLEELAAPLDVSHQAISERLRRGVGSLIKNTVAKQSEQASASTGGSSQIDSHSSAEPTLARPIGLGLDAQ